MTVNIPLWDGVHFQTTLVAEIKQTHPSDKYTNVNVNETELHVLVKKTSLRRLYPFSSLLQPHYLVLFFIVLLKSKPSLLHMACEDCVYNSILGSLGIAKITCFFQTLSAEHTLFSNKFFKENYTCELLQKSGCGGNRGIWTSGISHNVIFGVVVWVGGLAEGKILCTSFPGFPDQLKTQFKCSSG